VVPGTYSASFTTPHLVGAARDAAAAAAEGAGNYYIYQHIHINQHISIDETYQYIYFNVCINTYVPPSSSNSSSRGSRQLLF